MKVCVFISVCRLPHTTHLILFLQSYVIYVSIRHVPLEGAIHLQLQSPGNETLAALLPDARSIHFAGHMMTFTLCSSIMLPIPHTNLTDSHP